MPLQKSTLKEKIETELQAQGFELGGQFAMASKMATAIANAVVDEIQQNAEVDLSSGKVS